jgi:hypothetical protein
VQSLLQDIPQIEVSDQPVEVGRMQAELFRSLRVVALGFCNCFDDDVVCGRLGQAVFAQA